MGQDPTHSACPEPSESCWQLPLKCRARSCLTLGHFWDIIYMEQMSMLMLPFHLSVPRNGWNLKDWDRDRAVSDSSKVVMIMRVLHETILHQFGDFNENATLSDNMTTLFAVVWRNWCFAEPFYERRHLEYCIGHASEFNSSLILWQNNLVPGTLNDVTMLSWYEASSYLF